MSRPTDAEIREALGKVWDRQDPVVDQLGQLADGKPQKRPCCGGKGLVVGCPRCGKRWGR